MTIRSTTERNTYASGPDFPFKLVKMDIVVTENKGQMYVNDQPCEVTHKPGDEYQTVDMGKIYVELVTPLYQDPKYSLIDLHVNVEPVSVQLYAAIYLQISDNYHTWLRYHPGFTPLSLRFSSAKGR